MVLGAITGVHTPACLSAASNPVEAVTPPFGAGTNIALGHSKNYVHYSSVWFTFYTAIRSSSRVSRIIIKPPSVSTAETVR